MCHTRELLALCLRSSIAQWVWADVVCRTVGHMVAPGGTLMPVGSLRVIKTCSTSA
jgi:hypothetical protein